MTHSFLLLPECILRRARVADIVEILKLVFNLQGCIMPWYRRWICEGILMAVAVWILAQLCYQIFYDILHLAIIIPLSLRLILWGILTLGRSICLLAGSLKNWSRFWVVECNGYLVACARLCHRDGYSVLNDVFVVRVWRNQGLGSHLVQYLTEQTPQPIYLQCRPNLANFYERTGFVEAQKDELPRALQQRSSQAFIFMVR